MDELEKRLLIIYTVIAIILIALYMVILFGKELLKWAFAILLIFPIACIGLFFMFVTIYMFAQGITGNDFFWMQIITNIFNIVLVYRIFVDIKDCK